MNWMYELYFKHFHRFLYLRRFNGLRSQWFVYNYLKKYIFWKDVSPSCQEMINPEVRDDKTIWIFWKQGVNSAPDIVKKCIESVKRWNQGYDVVVLDSKSIGRYVVLPPYIEKLKLLNRLSDAHYSDLIRTQLLVQYGGIWCDATCFFSAQMPEFIENAPFFMFSRLLLSEYVSPIEGSNWFIKAKKNNTLLIKQRNFLYEYYRKIDYPIHYFLYHIAMGLIIHNDKECSEIWNNKPYICNMDPHVLLYSFARKYSKDLMDNCLSSCFVHKLTYKFEKKLVKSSLSILDHFLSRESVSP